MEHVEPRASGTFILPPRPEHLALLAELEAVALAEAGATTVRGIFLTQGQAQDILTLHDALHSQTLRESLLNRTIPDMLATTIRVRCLTKRDSWDFHARKASG